MWVDGITFKSNRRNMIITVKVVNPTPLKKAVVSLEVKKDGILFSTFSASTNRSGEVSFRLSKVESGQYTATVVMLKNKSYVWDQSKGVIRTSYHRIN